MRAIVKRRLLTITLFLTLIVPGLVAFAPARQGPAVVELALSAGYDGRYRHGQWTAIRVVATNTGGTLDGEIRVRTGSGLTETTYLTPLYLESGRQVQRFIYVSLDRNTRTIQVEVLDQANNIVGRGTADVSMVGSGDLLYAVVADRTPYTDLTRFVAGEGTAYQTRWRPEHVPPLADALAGLNVMLFHNVDTGALNDEQVAAVTHWVLGGGHLIVAAGGDSWQATTARLAELLPVELAGSAPVASLAPLAEYLRRPIAALDAPVRVASTTPRAGAEVLVAAGDVPLVTRASYGAGVVDFVAVDPQVEPLLSWDSDDKGRLWYALLFSTGQQPSWVGGFSDWSAGLKAARTTSNTALPTFLQLCGFLGLYIALVGPLNYLVLKRLNRREWAWFTIPLFILGFSVMAYTVGFNLRGNTVTVNRLSVVQVWPDQAEAQVSSVIGVQSPRRREYDIGIERGYTLRTLPSQGTGLNVSSIISEGTRYAAESIPIDAGMIAGFNASGYEVAPVLEASAVWHLHAEQDPRLEVQVTNTTGFALQDAVLLFKGGKEPIGTLGTDDNWTFDDVTGPQDPAPLTLGTLSTYDRPYWTYGYARASRCFSYSGLPVTISDVMGEETFPCEVGRVNERKQELRQRYQLLSALVYDTDLSGGRDANVYIAAWSDRALYSLDMGQYASEFDDTTLYIFELPVAVVTDTDTAYIPPAMTSWTLIETTDPLMTYQGAPTERYRVEQDEFAAFQFMPLPAMRLAEVSALSVFFQSRGPVDVELWDWDAQAWVKIRLEADTTETVITNPAAFIGPENAVNARTVSGNPAVFKEVLYIKIGYHGRLAE